MADSKVYTFPQVSNLMSRNQQPFLQGRLNLSPPLHNSAPSRLQSVDDFQSLANGARDPVKNNQKSISLLNLFGFEREQYNFFEPSIVQCRYRAHDVPRNFTGGTLVPTNSPMDSDDDSTEMSPTSPLSPIEDVKTDLLWPRDSQLEPIHLLAEPKESTVDDCVRNQEPAPWSFRSGHDVKTCDESPDAFGLETLSLGETNKDSETITDDIDDELTSYDETFLPVSANQRIIAHRDITSETAINRHPPRSLSDSVAVKGNLTKLRRHKSVHFADTKGLELEIRIPISHADDLQVPPRLMEALAKLRAKTRKDRVRDRFNARGQGCYNSHLSHKSLVPNFQQPFLEPTFQKRVNQQMVCLESASFLPNSLSFTGVIRVVNLEFDKRVTVRYTRDNWRTSTDIPAMYVSSLAKFHQDQFSFHVVASDDLKGSDRIELAICYRLPLSNRQFWDNNYGHNYVITCLEHVMSQSDDVMMT